MGAGVKANERWGIFGGTEPKGIKKFKLLLCNRYNHKEIVGPEMHQMQRTKALLHRLGNVTYQARITFIPQMEKRKLDITIDGKYIVISVDASNPKRCWESEKIIALIKSLLKITEYTVVLTGGKMSVDRYKNAFYDCTRVKNLIGKTDLYEWVEIIRGAKFLVGCDSGSVHVAASVGTPSICLTGVWDGHRIMPYVPDMDVEGTMVPQCVYRRDVQIDTLPCFNCLSVGFGWKNKKCEEIADDAPCLCMHEIQVEDVIELIIHMLINNC